MPVKYNSTGGGSVTVQAPSTASTLTATLPASTTTLVGVGSASAFTAAQSFTPYALTDGANISWDVNVAQKASVTLGGNRTMSAVTNIVAGTTYYLIVIQDATGSRTLSWTTTASTNGTFDFGTATAPVLTTTASAVDILAFEGVAVGGYTRMRFLGIVKGFTA